MGLKMEVTVLTKKGNYFDVQLPAKRVVCPHCEGTGKVLRDGLLGAVISDEFMADPDFMQRYMGGDYDVRCSKCDGTNVVLDVDEESLSPKMRERLHLYIESLWADEQEIRNERRMMGQGEY